MIRPGCTVLLKPDISNSVVAERTSPELVGIVGRLAQECGAKVLIGDSPILPTVPIELLWATSGLSEIAKRYNFRLVSLEKAGSSPVAVDTRVYYISKAVLEADVIINLPRLRYDRWTGFVGSIGNMFGIVPGFQKGRLYAVDFSARGIARLLVDIYSAVTPEFNIIDASSVDVHSGVLGGFIGGSTDGVALDTVVATVFGLDHGEDSVIGLASEAGLGIGRLEGIQISGDSVVVEEVSFGSHEYSGLAEHLPAALLNLAAPMVKVTASVESSNCDSCGLCVSVCPTRAMAIEPGKRVPSFNKPLCVRCWCCQANCPSQAIRLQSSYLAGTFFHS